MARKPSISNMRHRVQLCSQKDVVVNGELWLARQGILEVWAEIVARSTQVFSPDGAAIHDRDKRSHTIRIRYRTDIEVSNLAWLFERRLKSSPRWFKILRVSQSEDSGSPFYEFDVRLVERSDAATPPVQEGPAKGLPDGVSF